MTQPDPQASAAVTYEFTDQVAIVTGASRGIGAEIAVAFARAGADLIVHGRDVDALQTTVNTINALGRRAYAISGNVREAATAEAIVQLAEEKFGRIDILVNNAGGNFAKRLEDMSANAWNATIETNLGGPFHCATASHRVFKRQGRGVIINIGSTAADYAHPLRGAYAAAKAGVSSLTRTMAWEWAGDNIRVNCVAPGAILTDASRFTNDTTANLIARHVPMKRLGTGSEIADVCLFLASAGASYITGETLTVRGGPMTSSPADLELIEALA